jgi:hypothetical protein
MNRAAQCGCFEKFSLGMFPFKWNGDFWEIEDADFHPFLRTIEAKLKQKNGYAEEKNT